MKILMLVFSLLLSMNLFAEDSDSHGDIVLTVDGFHNEKGIVRIALFTSSDGFPDQPAKAIKNLDTEIQDGKLKTSFMDKSYGIYAVSVLHDENRNGKMDTNWVGMPKEGFDGVQASNMSMENCIIDFELLPWAEPVPDVRFKVFAQGRKKIRIVEFTKEFVEPDWWLSGHIGYVIEAEFEAESRLRYGNIKPEADSLLRKKMKTSIGTIQQ
jgi:uncharacterized protein (DUF2141 family)